MFLCLGYVVYINTEYSHELRWRFSFNANASRFLCVVVASSCLAMAIAIYRLFQAAPIKHTADVFIKRHYQIGLVGTANPAACPLAYFFMSKWLQEFAYRQAFGLWIPAAAGSITLLIALFTAGYQTLKLAVSDPIKSLRYE